MNTQNNVAIIILVPHKIVCNYSQKLKLVLSRSSPCRTLDTGEGFGQKSKEPTLKRDEPLRPYLSRYTASYSTGQ
jgi:hypothetical protein